MGDLTKNFDKSEYTCKCGCGYFAPSHRLIRAMQQLRDKVGVPITLNSGCRCPGHNKREGGRDNSKHMVGKAADIVIRGYAPAEMFIVAEEVLDFFNGCVGLYHDEGFIHVEVRDSKKRFGIAELIESKLKGV